MNNLKIFNYNGKQIRTVKFPDGNDGFIAKDVCEVLEISNSRDALARLDDDEKGVVLTDTPGGIQEMQAVTESGLYSLVLGSRKPEAKQFKRWVTHEVLPAIRHHGGYLTPDKVEEALLNPDTLIRLATDLKREREFRQQLELKSAQQNQIINELQPKATYYDLVLQNKSLLSVTKIAKDYGMSGIALNNKLHALGIQYKQGDVWLLYQKHANKGYTQSKTHVIDDERNKFHTYWTQKGRLFIYELLKGQGILPLIEREQPA